MNSYVQLSCLIVSFLYGIFLYYCNQFNIIIINNKSLIFKLIISMFYVFDITLFYLLFLYKINGGILHIYFILLIILGYIFVCVKKRK